MKTPRQNSSTAAQAAPVKPRLGFLGVGWIGHHRMKAIAQSGLAEIAALVDASPALAAQAAASFPTAGPAILASFDEMLNAPLDGVVIATPSALHAEQAIAALERGLHVFCQKPLARNALETARVVAAARAADRLLAVDLSYRFIKGMALIRELVQGGELGQVFALDLVFHNAYGPDKAWFYDRELSGGGCVIDLGIHLVDLALWTLDFPRVQRVTSQLFEQGQPLLACTSQVEDYAEAMLMLAGGASVHLACSWKLAAGQDAVIEARFYGTQGGAVLRNVNGSFYEFVAERLHGTTRQMLSHTQDDGGSDWGGRAALDWVTRVAAGAGFDPAAEYLVDVATILDAIYC